MGLELVPAGRHPPDDVNVIIEIPKDADPVKYEVDKPSGAIFVDRVLSTPMRYPCNYGYVPKTLSEDGDPVDAMVLLPLPLLAGTVIRCRPVGLLNMEDEHGPDDKLLVAPDEQAFQDYAHIHDINDTSSNWRDRITHFFQHYKDLEPGKWVKLAGWGDAQAAREEVLASLARFAAAHPRPGA